MGSKYEKKGLRYLLHTLPGGKKFLRGKGYSSRGQPKVDCFVRETICIKIKQYSKTYKISSRQAFFKLFTLRSLQRRTGFMKLMKIHFKNKAGGQQQLRSLMENDIAQDNFYKNHVKKWLRDQK